MTSALALACSGSHQGNTRAGVSSAQVPASENLRGAQDRSSLDALRRGRTPNTARDSACRELAFDDELRRSDSVCRDAMESCWQKNRRDRFVTLALRPGACAGSLLYPLVF